MSRRRRVTFAVFVSALALAIGWPVGAHSLAKWRVARYKRQLKADGEKLTLAELVGAAKSDDDNGAPAFVAAVKHLGSFPYNNSIPAMRYVVPGRALLASRQSVLPTEEISNVWPGLRTLIEAAQGDLADLQTALEHRALNFNLDDSQIVNAPLGHLTRLKTAAQWLGAAAVLDLHDGRATNALKNVNALARLAVGYRSEPLLVSGLVRVAAGQVAVNATWEALQSADLPDEPLARLQASWESLELTRQAETALSVNRAIFDKAFAASRESFEDVNAQWGGLSQSSGLDELTEIGRDLLSDPRQGLKRAVHRYPGYWSWKWWWSYEDELVSLQFSQSAIEATRTARRRGTGGLALKQYDEAIAGIQRVHPAAGRWLTELAFNERAIRNFITRISELEMERRLVVAAIALKRYQLRHGQYPATLTALTPEFLSAVPCDAMDGQPLRYHAEAGGGSFVLYSIGADGVDDGGDPAPTEERIVRKQYWRGRDAVWPHPASAEEFKIYQATLRGFRRREWVSPRTVATNGMSVSVLKELELLTTRYNLILTNRSE